MAVACAELPEDQKNWFTGGGKVYLKAKEICNTKCSAREACLAKALEFEAEAGERHHVWGGMTARERDLMFGRLSIPLEVREAA